MEKNFRNPSDIIINGETLEELLDKHEKWLKGRLGGKQLSLKNIDLSYIEIIDYNLRDSELINCNLSHCDLTNCNLNNSDLTNCNFSNGELNYTTFNYSILDNSILTNSNFYDCNLSHCNLSNCDLSNSNLTNSNLTYAYLTYSNLNSCDLQCCDIKCGNLYKCNLCKTNLNEANLYRAILNNANLQYSNLSGVNLSGANLSGANLNGVTYNEATTFLAPQCPKEGSFIGYKKIQDKILKLFIPKDSLRNSGTTRKCRCSKAKLLGIYELDGKESDIKEITNDGFYNFIYKIGENIEIKNFDMNRWNECIFGIHFFMTFDEAVNNK